MIQIQVTVPFGYEKTELMSAISAHIPVSASEILDLRVLKETLLTDLRPDFFCRLTVALSLAPEREAGLLKMKKRVLPYTEPTFSLPKTNAPHRPVVVGAGPAGLFAALSLSEAGLCPILIERGLPADERTRRVGQFYQSRNLDPECNIQFGEGGAGTFSDGKLKVGQMDKYKWKILSTMVDLGAPPEILYQSAAHVGTDLLTQVVMRLRAQILALGGEVHFSTKVTKLLVKDGHIRGVLAEQTDGQRIFDTDTVFLGTGHSARDVFSMLKEQGIPMTAKGFGVGVRIEHPREYIDSLVYGKGHPDTLPTASYHLVTHLENGRSVYSFCMCPGGSVVAATSEQNSIVTNGMSEHSRNGKNSNAALLVSVTPDDFGSGDALAGLAYQEKIEKRAFALAGGEYRAPAVRLGDFLDRRVTAEFGEVTPTYPLGTVFADFDEVLPSYITDSLRAAIGDFDEWLPGYRLDDALLTAPETRSTSPVRVLRTTSYVAETLGGLYPIGEGAGYSGGIVSSAADGMRAAEAYILSLS